MSIPEGRLVELAREMKPEPLPQPSYLQNQGIAVFGRNDALIYTNLAPLGEVALTSITRAVAATITDSSDRRTLSLLEAARLNPGIPYSTEVWAGDNCFSIIAVLPPSTSTMPDNNLVLTVLDRTIEKQAQAEAFKTKEELERTRADLVSIIQDQEQLLTEAQQYVAMLVHDFKNPLTTIRASAQLLQRLKRIPRPRLQKSLETIISKVDQLNKFVGEHLDNIRSSMDYRLEPVALADVLTTTYKATADTMRQQKVTFRIEAPAADLIINVDSSKISMAVKNLITNAMHAVDGCPTKEVVIRGKQEDRYILICVEDTGIGVPEEDRERIFADYFTRKKARQNGSGLGLSIAQRVARRHGGDVYIESTVTAEDLKQNPDLQHTGSIFVLKIPLPQQTGQPA